MNDMRKYINLVESALEEGDVIKHKFADRLMHKKGMYKNPDIEVPEGYDRFEAHKTSFGGKIVGIRGDRAYTISTTNSFALADALASAYNAGGYTNKDIQRVPMGRIEEAAMTSPLGFVTNIEQDTIENNDYRRVLYTANNCQLVVMAIQPGEEIGWETHDDLDQFIRVEAGEGMVEFASAKLGAGTVALDSAVLPLRDGSAIVVPAGTQHNVTNTGTEPLKLYAVYAPPNHKKGTVHHTKGDETEEHFDGDTDL